MSWITTASSKHLDFINPHPDQITIEDIATGLSGVPRWGGQLSKWYSVAEHCILMLMAYTYMTKRINPKICQAILLHDATEAYMGDIPRPLKALIPDYQSIEKKLDIIIKLKFGVSTNPEIQDTVHTFDEIMLKNEAIARGGDINWLSDQKYKSVKLIPFFTMHYFSPEEAKRGFLNQWKKTLK
jgi:hypothetical protein